MVCGLLVQGARITALQEEGVFMVSDLDKGMASASRCGGEANLSAVNQDSYL